MSALSLSCDSVDYSPPGSSVHGIRQARILEWDAISFSRISSLPRARTHVSYIGRWESLTLSHLGSPYTTTIKVQNISIVPQCLLIPFGNDMLFSTP